MNTIDHDVLRRYLLGVADSETADDIDRRLFSEDEVFFERLLIAEDELIDDRAAQALGEEENRLFDSNFLNTEERRTKLEFALAVREYARTRRERRAGVWTWLGDHAAVPRWVLAAAASLVVLASGLAWQFGTAGRVPPALAVELSPGLLRDAGAETARVRLSSGCQIVHLDLATTPGRYTQYSASVHSDDGSPVWSQHGLSGAVRQGSVIVRLAVPCELLAEADYWVRLSGVSAGEAPSPLDRYDFRVLRQ
jgi:hypothetical protein